MLDLKQKRAIASITRRPKQRLIEKIKMRKAISVAPLKMFEDERIRIVGIKSQLIMAVVGLNPLTQFRLKIGVQVENTRQSGFSILRFRPS